MRRIDFKDFQDIVKNEILDYLPDDFQNAEIKISKMEKLGKTYNAMTIMREKNGMSPAINLDRFYEEYQNGSMLPECLHTMARTIRDSQREFNVDWIQNYDEVKKHLFIRVSNAEKNEVLLEKVPHELKDDLVITCHIEISNEYGSLMSAIVSNQMLDMYGITREQLIQDSIENSVRIMPPTIRLLGDIIGEHMPETKGGVIPAYVISNKIGLNGASAMFYPNVLEYVSQKIGGDVIIAPSSIHEVIALPVRSDEDIGRLEDTVRFINDTQVSESEQLGDHLYKYDARSHSLESIWSDSATNNYTNSAFLM